MNYKVILWDVDGVLIKRERYFSDIYAEKVGIDVKTEMLPFFKGPFTQVVIGKADLKDEIKPWLNKWKWEKDVDSFLQNWFESEAIVQQDILKLVEDLKEKGYLCYLCSQQEKYRTEYLWNTLKLRDYFDGKFITCEIGYRKEDRRFFEEILQQLNMEPNETLYFDDEEENVNVAKEVGINAVLYRSFQDIKII